MNPTMSFRRSIAVLIVAGLVYIGHGLHSTDSDGRINSAQPAMAGGVGVATENDEIVLTASEDGRTIYMWQYYSSKPPKFMGKSEAIETP